MWFFTSDSFVSIVQDRDNARRLLVRARRSGDVERFLAPVIQDDVRVEVFTDDQADYKFRAFVARHQVENAIRYHVQNLRYDNFKNSIRDHELHGAASRVWSVMYSLQRDDSRRSWFSSAYDGPDYFGQDDEGLYDDEDYLDTPEETVTVEAIAQALHYPECWDTMAYPTLLDAIREMSGCTTCKN